MYPAEKMDALPSFEPHDDHGSSREEKCKTKPKIWSEHVIVTELEFFLEKNRDDAASSTKDNEMDKDCDIFPKTLNRAPVMGAFLEGSLFVG